MDYDKTIFPIAEFLESRGLEYRYDRDWIKTKLTYGMMNWETALGWFDKTIYIYGCYPGRLKNKTAGYELCNNINSKITSGTVFIQDDGHMVFKTYVSTKDPYDLSRRLAEAFDYNIQVIKHFWNDFERIKK